MEKYALTGTPGTGKTSVSKLLNEKVTSLSDYYEEASEGKTNSGEWVVNIEKFLGAWLALFTISAGGWRRVRLFY